MTRNSTLGVLACLCLIWVVVGEPTQAQIHRTDRVEQESAEQTQTQFNGEWILVGTQSASRARVDRAINRVVSQMNFFMQPVARGLIRDNTPINRFIGLNLDGDNSVTVNFDRHVRYTTQLGRPARRAAPGGERFRLTQRFRRNQLEQVFESDRGTRWNLYTLQPDGTLQLDATLNGEMLPQPIRFSLRYRRNSEG